MDLAVVLIEISGYNFTDSNSQTRTNYWVDQLDLHSEV